MTFTGFFVNRLIDISSPASRTLCVSQMRPRVSQSLLFTAALFTLLGAAQRGAAQTTIKVTTTQQGVLNPSANPPGDPHNCSLQEAIYSAEFGASIALSQTNPDTPYNTGCAAGTGKGDTIVLPPGAVFNFDHFWDGDAHNYVGPTATPIIFKTIILQGNGATLQWTMNNGDPENFRLFAVGQVPDSGPLAISLNGNTYSGTGNLTLQNVYISRASTSRVAMAASGAVVVAWAQVARSTSTVL